MPDQNRERTLVLLLALWCITAITTGCGQNVHEGNPYATYTCEGACEPVRFVVFVPNEEDLSEGVYLSGSFNNWVFGDKKLKLKSDPAILDKEFNVLGTPVSLKEREAFKPFWIDLELPVGASIEYRYTKGYGTPYNRSYDEPEGIPEEGAYRTLQTRRDLVQIDSVHQWSTYVIKTEGPEDLGYDQVVYLKRHMADFVLPEGTRDPLGAVFEKAAAIWNEEGMRLMPGYPHVLLNAYYSLFYEQRNAGMLPADQATECRMFTDYLLPAYEREHAYAEAHLNHGDAHRGMVLQAAWVFDAVNCPSLADTTWEQIASLYYDTIPGYLDLYRRKGDEDVQEILDYYTKNVMKAYAPDFAFRRALHAGELDTAQRLVNETVFDTTGTFVKLDHATHRLYFMPRALASAYAGAGRTEEALGLLDRVGRHTTVWTLSGPTLNTWYEEVAGEVGAERFALLVATGGRKPLAGTGDPMPYAAAYPDLTNDVSFDLATLKGKIVVFDFWALWCAPCIWKIPQLIAFHQRIRGAR